MSKKYISIGYIGWTADMETLATALTASANLQRDQYVWCPGEEISAEKAQAAGVTVVTDLVEMASACMTFVLTDGSDASVLEVLPAMMNPGALCADIRRVLPTEKYACAKKWEAAGGFYTDMAFEGTMQDAVNGQRVFYSGNAGKLAYRAFYRLLFPVWVPGEAGEATLLRLLRTTPVGTLSDLLPYIEYYHKTCPADEVPELIADQPENEGVANVLKRARQMTDVVWQPLKKFPKVYGLHETDDFSPEFPVIGLPYSSTRMEERFIGPNLSMETFFTALEDENSVLYTRDFRHHGNAAAYYGTVCSVLVGNAINLHTRVPTKLWPNIPGMHLIEPNTVESLKLGDTLLNATHVAIVTGIDRTVDGKVYQVHVSESTHSTCICGAWRADIFTEYWLNATGFRIYRYDGVNTAPYEPSPYIPLEGEELVPAVNADLSLNFGNKANCRLGEEVTFSVKTEGWDLLRIERDGTVAKELALEGKTQLLNYQPETCGAYRALCVKASGEVSKFVEFAVVSCSVATDKAVYKLGEPIMAIGSDCGGAKPECAFLIYDGILNYRVRETQQIQWFTPEEQAAGKGAVYYNIPGPYMLKLFFRNQYGVYGSDYVKLEIKEN